MSTDTLCRIVWGTLGLFCVGFWSLAIIGARSLTVAPECPSVWEAVKTTMAGPR